MRHSLDLLANGRLAGTVHYEPAQDQWTLCWRQRGFDPGCRFQLTPAKPARVRAMPGFFGYVDGSAISGSLDRFGIGTNIQATKLPLTRWFLAMHLLTQAKNNVSALELKRHLGVRYKSAWLIKHKLLQVMFEREEPRQLDGRVEIDDAYLGGALPGGKAGRGSQNKVPFIAAVQTTDAGQPVLVCLKKLAFTKEALAQWATKTLCASARVVSDGLACFTGVTTAGASHERTVTGGGAASVKLKQFHAVNTLLGNLKTSFSGTYHSFDFAKYGQRYLAEVQYRFNRRFDLSAILSRLLRAASLTSPHPERIIRAAELGG